MPFYIGIGTRYENSYSYPRANDKIRRTEIWKSIVYKYGHYIEIIFESFCQEEILCKEKEFILLYGRSVDGGILCNVSSGGNNPTHVPLTESHKLNLSNIHKGVRKSKGFCEKLSKRSLGNKYNLGKPLSEKTKEKIRDKNIIHYNNLSLGEQNTIKERLLDIGSRPKLNYIKSENYEINKAKERKKVLKFSMENQLLFEYNSLTEAASCNNLSIGKISLCCNKKRKSHGKFIWKFKEEIEKDI